MNKNVLSKLTSNNIGNSFKEHSASRSISIPILPETNTLLFSDNNHNQKSSPSSIKHSLLNIFPKSFSNKNIKAKLNFSPGEEAYRNYYYLSNIYKSSKSINPLLINDTHAWNVSSQDLEKAKKFQRDYTLDNATCQLRKMETDSDNRDYKSIIPAHKWNRSTELHDRYVNYSKENNYKLNQISLVSRNNSRNYWKKNQSKRIHSMPYELSQNRNLVEIQRFYKPYVNPEQKYKEKIKEVNEAKLELYKKKDLYYRLILDDFKNINSDDAWKLVDERLERERIEKTKSIFSKDRKSNKALNSVIESLDTNSLSSVDYSSVSKSIKNEDFLKGVLSKRKNIEESLRRNISNRSFLDRGIKYMNVAESNYNSRYPISKEQFELNKEKKENELKSHDYYKLK